MASAASDKARAQRDAEVAQDYSSAESWAFPWCRFFAGVRAIHLMATAPNWVTCPASGISESARLEWNEVVRLNWSSTRRSRRPRVKIASKCIRGLSCGVRRHA